MKLQLNVPSYLKLLFLSLLLISGQLLAQSSNRISVDPITGKPTSIWFNPESRARSRAITPRSLVAPDGKSQAVRDLARANGYDVTNVEFLSLTNSKDTTGSTSRFEQYISGIRVFGSSVIVNQTIDGRVTSVVFRLSEARPREIKPKISPAEFLKRIEEVYPKDTEPYAAETPSLVIYDPHILNPRVTSSAHLAWSVKVESLQGQTFEQILIDAISGDILNRLSLVFDDLSRQVFDCSYGDGDCYLDQYSSYYNYFFGRSEGTAPRGLSPRFSEARLDVDDLYNTLGFSYAYFRDRHGRDGANRFGGIAGGAYAGLTIAAAYGNYGSATIFNLACPNAHFNPSPAYVGGHLSFCPGMVSTDVVGHEYTHALVYHSLGGLNNYYETGALSEGLADIFGEAVERYTFGSSDWITGTSVSNPAAISGARNIMNPEANGLPSSNYSSNLDCSSDDNGGIHTNCSVIAYVAKLLAKGGNNGSCNISAIGETKQEAIFYRAITNHLTSSSSFQDAYNAVLLSCFDLYGQNSSECKEVAKALNASMLNQPGRCTGIPATSVDCDNCPLDSAKNEPGQCGCGAADTDSNSNGIADCNEIAIAVEGIVPPTPILKPGKRFVNFQVTHLAGTSTVLKLVVKQPPTAKKPKPKGRVYYYDITETLFSLSPFKKGTTVTGTLFYYIPGTPPRWSRESSRKSVRVK